MNGEINKSLKKINATVEMKNLNIKSHLNLKEENAHSPDTSAPILTNSGYVKGADQN